MVRKLPTTIPEVEANPTYVGLFNMAARLNTLLKAQLETPIAYMTPYDWHRRTKEESISLPMPDVKFTLTGNAGKPTPVWAWSEIVHWYVGFAGVVGPKMGKRA